MSVRDDVKAAMHKLGGVSSDDKVNDLISAVKDSVEWRRKGLMSDEDCAEHLFSAAYLMNRHVFGERWSPERALEMSDEREATQGRTI
jgi:hypothetical protein